jgi:hypothetical protein
LNLFYISGVAILIRTKPIRPWWCRRY